MNKPRQNPAWLMLSIIAAIFAAIFAESFSVQTEIALLSAFIIFIMLGLYAQRPLKR